MSPEPDSRIYDDIPGLENPTLIAGWAEDAGRLGSRVIDYLIRQLDCREFGEILPEGFFPLTGVIVENDVAQFPESKFYVSDAHNLIIFRSNTPRSNWYRFLNTELDISLNDCGVKQVYAIGAMVSSAAHTMPRLILSAVNSGAIRDELLKYGVNVDMNYETPAGQKPTLNSYLIWTAGRRGLPAASLWIPIPYYLMNVDDPRACKRYIDFFNRSLNLGMDTAELDEQIKDQNDRITQIFAQHPDLEGYVRKLEINQPLEQEESEKLARAMAEFLNKP